MPEATPSVQEILSEWSISVRSVDRALWQTGIDRYEAGSLKDPAGMELTAELLCVAFVHYLNDGSTSDESPDEWPDGVIDHTAWDVLVATLQTEHGSSLTPGPTGASVWPLQRSEKSASSHGTSGGMGGCLSSSTMRDVFTLWRPPWRASRSRSMRWRW